jgi:hypothetical protein
MTVYKIIHGYTIIYFRVYVHHLLEFKKIMGIYCIPAYTPDYRGQYQGGVRGV